MKKWLTNILIILVLLPPCGEIAARIMGWGPADYSEYKVEAEPSNWLVGDERMGIRLNPGTYEVTLNDHVKFKTTHSQYFTRGEVELNFDKSCVCF